MWSPARGNRPMSRTIIGNVAPVSNTSQPGQVQNLDAQRSPSIVAVSAGRTSTIRRGTREVTTAFVKSPLSGPVDVGVLGIGGDEHVYEHHGGPDMALLAYPFEHYDHWKERGLDLPVVAAMAENLTTTGLVETEVAIGDVFTIGTATVQVTATQPLPQTGGTIRATFITGGDADHRVHRLSPASPRTRPDHRR